MPDIYGSHFTYRGISSRAQNYSLILSNVDTSRYTALNGSIEGVTVFNKNAKKRYLIDDDYSESPLSFDVNITTECGETLSVADRRTIEKWLFNRPQYSKLYLDAEDDTTGETSETIDGVVKRLYLNCRFVNPTRLEYNNGIVGYKATLEADGNMWWQDPVTKTFNLNQGSNASRTVSVVVDTDLPDYIYPTVTIVMGNTGGDLTIINQLDSNSRLTKFVGLSRNVTLTLKGELGYVSGQYYEKFDMRNFPRLLDGTNNITVMGNVSTISFEFQNRRHL